MTFNPILPRVKVNLLAKNQGRRSNGLGMKVQTDGQTDRHTHRTDNITSSANAEVINHIQITAGCGFSAMSVQWTHNLTFVIGESNASMGMMNLVYLA